MRKLTKKTCILEAIALLHLISTIKIEKAQHNSNNNLCCTLYINSRKYIVTIPVRNP